MSDTFAGRSIDDEPRSFCSGSQEIDLEALQRAMAAEPP
jgi:hypothetical protein